MAFGQYDGSIRIDTRIDNSGFEKGIEQQTVSLKSQAAKRAAIYRKEGMSQSEAMKKAWSEIERTSVSATSNIAKRQKTITSQNLQFGNSLNNAGAVLENRTVGIGNSLNKIGLSVKKFAATVGIAFGVSTLIKFGKEAINLASDIQEVQNVVDTAFGAMSGMVEEFADTAIEKFGMSELAAKQTASTYMAMSKCMGMYGEQAAQMAIDAAARTGDIASFYNMTQKEADTMLKSIWTGETESLKRIGVVMTQTNLDQYALQKGFGKTTSAMNQQELTLLRYQYVMDKTGLAAGDFQKTQDSWANQTRVLTERWKQFLSLMGTGLIQILTPALKFLNQMMSVLIRFAETFSKVTAALFGKQTLNTAAGAAIATEGAASATDDYAASVENAKKKQDKFLAGLDEITTLNEKNSDSAPAATNTSAGSVSVPALSGEIGGDVTLSPALQTVIDKVTGFFDKLKQIDLTPAKEALSRLWESLKPFGETIGEGLAWFWDNILVPLGKWVLEDAVPAFLDLLAGAISFLDPIIEAFKENFQWLWDNFLQPIAEWTGGVIVSVLESLAEKLTELGDWMRDNQGTVTAMTAAVIAIAAAVTAFFAAWKIVEFLAQLDSLRTAVDTSATALDLLTSAFKKNIVEKIKDQIETAKLSLMLAKDFLKSLAQSTAALVKQAAQWVVTTAGKIADTAATWASQAATLAATAATWLFNTALTVLTSPITLVILAIGALIAIVVLCVKHWDEIKEAASKAWDWIKEKWHAAGEWFNTNVVEPIKTFFTNLGDSIKNAFSTAWEWIKGVWNKASSWVNDTVIVPIANFFSGLWDGIKKAFTTAFDFIKTAFKNYVNGWISIVENFINFFIKAINLLIKGLNKISFDVPDWVPSIGGKTFGFDIKEVPKVSIPRLATGAVIPPNAEFAAILGDQKHGRNLEAPESLLRQIAREESGANLTVILQMPNGEEKEVFSTKNLAQQNRQSGRILIPINAEV